MWRALEVHAGAADLGDRAADCASLWGCFKMTLSGGVRNFGGVGDVLTPSNGGARVAFDLLCFAVVGLVMSLFGGIIRDTFAALRPAVPASLCSYGPAGSLGGRAPEVLRTRRRQLRNGRSCASCVVACSRAVAAAVREESEGSCASESAAIASARD